MRMEFAIVLVRRVPGLFWLSLAFGGIVGVSMVMKVILVEGYLHFE